MIQKQMTHADYNASEDARKIVDAVRLGVAEDTAKHNGMSVEDALAGVIDLHEAECLTLVGDEDGNVGLAACVPVGDGMVEDDPKPLGPARCFGARYFQRVVVAHVFVE